MMMMKIDSSKRKSNRDIICCFINNVKFLVETKDMLNEKKFNKAYNYIISTIKITENAIISEKLNNNIDNSLYEKFKQAKEVILQMRFLCKKR